MSQETERIDSPMAGLTLNAPPRLAKGRDVERPAAQENAPAASEKAAELPPTTPKE